MLNVQKDAFYLPLKLIATLFKAQSVKLFRRNNPYLSFHVFAVWGFAKDATIPLY